MEELISNEELTKYTPYEFNPYIVEGNTGISIEGGRGCPFNCSFCSTSGFWGRKYRIKPVDDLIYEMKKLNKIYKFKFFNIQHDLFTANRKAIVAFCNKIIDERLNLSWGCSSRVDVLDYDLIELMAKANCKSMFLGIETGSKRMQKILNKNLNIDGTTCFYSITFN